MGRGLYIWLYHIHELPASLFGLYEDECFSVLSNAITVRHLAHSGIAGEQAKFWNVKNFAFVLRRMNDELCSAYGLSMIENPKKKKPGRGRMTQGKIWLLLSFLSRYEERSVHRECKAAPEGAFAKNTTAYFCLRLDFERNDSRFCWKCRNKIFSCMFLLL